MKWKKVLVGAGLLCTAAAVAGKISRDQKRKEELDAFLVPENEDSMIVDIPNLADSLSELRKDLVNWSASVETESIVLSFYFEQPTSIDSFVENVRPFCSKISVNEEDHMVDVTLSNQESELKTQELIEVLSHTLPSYETKYLGFYLTKE